jgi:protein gp37
VTRRESRGATTPSIPGGAAPRSRPRAHRCYAEAVDARFSAGDPHWGKNAPRRFFGDKHWNEPLRWNRAASASGERRLVFCASMADVLEDRAELVAHRPRLWSLIRDTPALTWLLLTKRPQNIGRMVPDDIRCAPNAWFGTTVESNAYRWRVTKLLEQAPKAARRFVSVEPMLDMVNLMGCPGLPSDDEDVLIDSLDGTYSVSRREEEGTPIDAKIDWVIAGCESGDGARETPTKALRWLRDQCARNGTAFLLKQAAEGAEGITLSTNVANCPAVTGNDPPFRKRDIRTGPNGIRRAHYLIERPFLDGKQHLEFPAR